MVPWVVCPGAKWQPVGAWWGPRGQVVLQACVATIVGGASMVGAGWLQLHPKNAPWWCCVCLLPWVVHPGGKWQPGGHCWGAGGGLGYSLLWPLWVLLAKQEVIICPRNTKWGSTGGATCACYLWWCTRGQIGACGHWGGAAPPPCVAIMDATNKVAGVCWPQWWPIEST